MFNKFRKHNEEGFMLPSMMILLSLIAIIGATMIQTTLASQTAAIKHSYVQIAHVASKAGIDYAKEQFELLPSYSGTAEFTFITNSRYRVTIEVDVLQNITSTQKRIQSYGRVYIPDTASTAAYVRDIKSTIIRNGELAGDPGDYYPSLWLDTSAANSLYKGPASNSQTIVSLNGSSNADVVEEYGADATTSSNRGDLDFSGTAMEMPCASGVPPCGGSFGTQKSGLRFRNVSAPKNATITNAYIQFTEQSTQTAGALTLDVRGIAQDDPTSWSGNYDVTNRTKTTASTAWSPPNWNSVNASGANERVSVTSIVQELVNRSGWNPSQAMSFAISYTSGSGVRKAYKGRNSNPKPSLYIQWTDTGGQAATTTGDTIERWEDVSGNNNDAVFAFGTRPTLQTNQINGKSAIRFSTNGNLVSNFASSLVGTGATVMAVMRPRTTSASDARFVSFMNSAQNADNNTLDGGSVLQKSGSSTTMTQRYNNTNGETLSGAIDGAWGMHTSRFGDLRVERLLKNSSPDNYSEFISGVNYSVNQIYVGGTRSVAAGANYADMDIAELVVYNKELSCSQLQLVEYYFSQKYNISITFKDPCP